MNLSLCDVVEVRCCCNPAKVLGTVLLAGVRVRVGEAVTFALARGGVLTLEMGQWDVWMVDEHFNETHEGGLALKSNETPIETLRQIPGFVEAVP